MTAHEMQHKIISSINPIIVSRKRRASHSDRLHAGRSDKCLYHYNT